MVNTPSERSSTLGAEHDADLGPLKDVLHTAANVAVHALTRVPSERLPELLDSFREHFRAAGVELVETGEPMSDESINSDIRRGKLTKQTRQEVIDAYNIRTRNGTRPISSTLGRRRSKR
jgi:hypothetical protein